MMGAFYSHPGLSDSARRALEELVASGSSEAIGVAEILNTIAENGDEMESDEFLVRSAYEIVRAALKFKRLMASNGKAVR